MAVTSENLADYLAALNEVNRLAQGDLVSLWRVLEGLDREEAISYLLDAFPDLVGSYRSLAVETATVFYEETQDLRFTAAEAAAASEVPEKSLRASVESTLRAEGNVGYLALLGGVTQRYIFNGPRTYAMDGFRRAGTGWYRAARPEACNFCRMLATRSVKSWGPYTSADAAFTVGSGRDSRGKRQPRGSSFHDNCRCIPVRAGSYQPPSYVEAWEADYNAAVSAVGNQFDFTDILSEMRKISGHSH